MNFQRRSVMDEEEPTINVTPLMDIMFLLVIFLVVTTTFRIFPGLGVTLPRAKSEAVQQEEHTLVADLTRDGQIFLGGKRVERKNLLKAMRLRQASSPVLLFVVEADENARHGQVVELMDMAKRVGIARLAIATREHDQAPTPEARPEPGS